MLGLRGGVAFQSAMVVCGSVVRRRIKMKKQGEDTRQDQDHSMVRYTDVAHCISAWNGWKLVYCGTVHECLI